VALARAALAAIPAIRDACPGARIVNVDPICRMVPPAGASSEAVAGVHAFNRHAVFQFFDMVAGRLLPELGGSLDALDIVGLNYYATNQWELGCEGTGLPDDDPRRVPLADIVRDVAERYGRPVAITETSDCDERRGGWLHGISRTVLELLDDGVELCGVCIYPILGMLEWHDRNVWVRMGAWDLESQDGRLVRKPYQPMLDALRDAQASLPSLGLRRAAGVR
jgi:hypothetical protein